MGIAGTLTAMLRRRKADRDSDGWAGYRSLLQSVIDGESLDPEEVAIALETLEKTPGDLEADAEVYRKRVRWAKQAAAGEGAEAEVQRLQLLMEQRGAALEEHIRAEREALQKLSLERAAAEARASAAASARQNLVSTCLDSGLTQRVGELRQRQREIGQRLTEIDDQLADNSTGSIPGELDFAKQNLARWEATSPAGTENSRQYVESARTEFGRRVARFEELLSELQQQRSSVAAELAAINNELRKIDEQKLVP